jgi:hypothetical protein
MCDHIDRAPAIRLLEYNDKRTTVMAREENEFQKLLSDAPMAPDTVTLIGALARSGDPAKFVLTLLNGRSETLDVAAVKAAKPIAGPIGLSLVQLEVDARRVPENIRNPAVGGPDSAAYGDVPVSFLPKAVLDSAGARGGDPLSIAPFVAMAPRQAAREYLEAAAISGRRTYITAYEWTGDNHLLQKPHADPS